ncbi:hypothetical protein N9Q03_01380 [Flavobacteriaceae bacterium]|jgi:hypothetical protein|nr:hypothetical protein [Flavobacteriaceae bacterium]
MGTVELRNKWKEAIGKVDDRFLRMVDALYETYSKDQVDFFEELPKEIQELLIESRENIKNGDFFTHEEVMSEVRKKFNISE